mgnify:CR=1 FL=1
MNELEHELTMITKYMADLHQVIMCNYTHLDMTMVYDRLDQLAKKKHLKLFALQLEKQYANNL